MTEIKISWRYMALGYAYEPSVKTFYLYIPFVLVIIRSR